MSFYQSSLSTADVVHAVNATEPTAEIEVSIDCANLADMDTFSKSDPFVVAYVQTEMSTHSKPLQRSRSWTEVGRTEIIWDNLNPHFAESFKFLYHFERLQHVRFDVYDADTPNRLGALDKHDFIGTTGPLRLGDIVSAVRKGYSLTRPERARRGKNATKSYGTLFTTAEQTGSASEFAHFKLRASGLPKMDLFGLSDPFLEVKRRSPDGQRWVTCHRTKPIMKNLNPSFPEFSVSVAKLCPHGDRRRPLRLEVWDYNASGDHDYIGMLETTLDALLANDAPTQLHDEQRRKGKKGGGGSLCCGSRQAVDGKGVPAGQLITESVRVVREDTFVDFIQGGCEINLMVAVDFTASNGDPNTTKSLHALRTTSGQGNNQYKQAIQAVGNILAPYDHDGEIPALGFGARFPNGQVSHCFNLNGDTAPECRGVAGVLSAYERCLRTVQLYGPTNFADFLTHANSCAAAARVSQAQQQYFVLLVITDGCISDMQRTVDTIVAGSDLPLSIIITGVGDADFSSMERLDADEARLVASSGQVQARDSVQFVPFNDFKHAGPARLAAEVLQEVPAQLLGFMKAHGLRPNAPAAAAAPLVAHAVPVAAAST